MSDLYTIKTEATDYFKCEKKYSQIDWIAQQVFRLKLRQLRLGI